MRNQKMKLNNFTYNSIKRNKIHRNKLIKNPTKPVSWKNYKTLNGKASHVHEAETLILLRWQCFSVWSRVTKSLSRVCEVAINIHVGLWPWHRAPKTLPSSEWWQRRWEHFVIVAGLDPGFQHMTLNPCAFPEWQEHHLLQELTPG